MSLYARCPLAAKPCPSAFEAPTVAPQHALASKVGCCRPARDRAPEPGRTCGDRERALGPLAGWRVR